MIIAALAEWELERSQQQDHDANDEVVGLSVGRLHGCL